MHATSKLEGEHLHPKKDKAYRKAVTLGQRYPARYGGCAQATFAAIADALNLKGEEVFKALIGLSGGVGNMGRGACGAMAGAAAAISLKFGVGRNALKRNPEAILKVKDRIYELVEKVGGRFLEEFGSYLCRDIQLALFGKAFNLRNPEAYMEFKQVAWPKACSREVVAKAVGWAVEVILEAEERKP